MKFGKRIAKGQEERWAEHYVDYKHLKKIIKGFLTGEHQVADFGLALRSDLKKVNEFFSSQDRVLLAQKRAITEAFDTAVASGNKREELTNKAFGALTCFSKEIDALRNYVVLNYMAVIKIVKKRNKNVDPLFDGRIDAQSILLSQNFYRSRTVADLLTFTELLTLKHNPGDTKPDQANFMCAVCLETLNNPVVLTCGHRFCFGCSVRCTAQNVLEEEVVQCPTCRKQGPCQPASFSVDTTMTEFLIRNFGVGDEDEARKVLSRQLIPYLTPDMKPSKVDDARWTMKCLPSPPRVELGATAAAASTTEVAGVESQAGELPGSSSSGDVGALAPHASTAEAGEPGSTEEKPADDILTDIDLNFLLESGAFEDETLEALNDHIQGQGGATLRPDLAGQQRAPSLLATSTPPSMMLQIASSMQGVHSGLQTQHQLPMEVMALTALGQVQSSPVQREYPPCWASPREYPQPVAVAGLPTKKSRKRQRPQDSRRPSGMTTVDEQPDVQLEVVQAEERPLLAAFGLLDDLTELEECVAQDTLNKSVQDLLLCAPGSKRKRPLAMLGVLCDQDAQSAALLKKFEEELGPDPEPEGLDDRERNRLAAQRFRQRREIYVNALEAKALELENRIRFCELLQLELVERNEQLKGIIAEEGPGSCSQIPSEITTL